MINEARCLLCENLLKIAKVYIPRCKIYQREIPYDIFWEKIKCNKFQEKIEDRKMKDDWNC